MDIYDVSGSEQYLQVLTRQKEVLKAARARQGEHPKDRRPRSELVGNFMIQHTRQQLLTSDFTNLHSSFVPPPYQPSTTPLEKLKQMFIEDLRLETHHRGSYLLLRSITPPNRMTAIMAIVEDEMKDAVMLQLYQQDDKIDRSATSILNQNDVFLVKEPYFKIMADGDYGLRVDHVSDLVKIEPRDQRVPLQWSPRVLNLDKTASDWKLEGNDAMRERKYWIAIQRCLFTPSYLALANSMFSYTAALGCPTSVQEWNTVRLNRALAYLKNEYFDAALMDTDCLTSPSDAPEKALYRAGQALYRLGRFSECQDILTLLCKKYPNNSDATVELTRVKCRLEEQRSGKCNFKAIYEQVSKLRPPHLDHATFVGPVTIKASEGRGRGLFTTKAVKAGDLILCEKAFAHCYADAAEENAVNSSTISLLMNVHTNQMTMGTRGDLITTIVQKLWRNPSFLPEVTSLHHGSYIPVDVTEVDGKPIIDTYVISPTDSSITTRY
jgi:tetratricopeptide (TPR) repeat protein